MKRALSVLGLAAALCVMPHAARAAPTSNLTHDREALLAHGPLSGLRVGERTTLRGFPLQGDHLVDLELERFSVIAPGAPMFIVDGDGRHRDVGDLGVVLLKGSVSGVPGSRAFVSVSPYGTHGFIEDGVSLYSITSGPAGPVRADGLGLRVTDAAGTSAQGRPGVVCGVSARQGLDALGEVLVAPAGYAAMRPRSGMFETEIAVETDWEYVSVRFGGNAAAASAYIQTLIGGVSQIYERDVNTTLTVVWSRVFTANNDPYPTGDDENRLYHLKDEWNANMNGVYRDVVHMLTGTSPPFAGIAFIGALCNSGPGAMGEDLGYGLTAYVTGHFPDPLQDYHHGNWDLFVCAHELGHNHGSLHTHDIEQYDPLIDGCGLGDCSGACGGTIMSYCPTCPAGQTAPPCQGGFSNVVMGFHPRVQDTILYYMDTFASCTWPAGCGPADCDANGVINLDDVDCFVAAFLAAAQGGDCDANGSFDLDDVDCFVTAFLAGCG